jgi:hypothetical protein
LIDLGGGGFFFIIQSGAKNWRGTMPTSNAAGEVPRVEEDPGFSLRSE